jgi:molybdopterin converting factor subunit 1
MRVHVKLFAVLRDKAGVSELQLELPEGATVSQAVRKLEEAHATLGPHFSRSAFAINQDYAKGDAELHDGDELALIPPVSGG